MKTANCNRAVLVGHNAHFDLGFLNEAIARCDIKRSPFHPFAIFDTASLAGVALGQTVLARASMAAGLSWDERAAHSAVYDAEITADLFCEIVNRFRPDLRGAGAAPSGVLPNRHRSAGRLIGARPSHLFCAVTGAPSSIAGIHPRGRIP